MKKNNNNHLAKNKNKTKNKNKKKISSKIESSSDFITKSSASSRLIRKGGGLFETIAGIFDSNSNSNSKNLNNLIMEKSKKSENELINAYEDYVKITKKYFSLYNNHLNNLKELEENKNISNLVDLFKKHIMNDEFNYNIHVDRSNPLLLNNYLVTDDTLRKNFLKEHVINQLRYAIHKFNIKDKILIESIGNVSIDGMKCNYTIKASTGDKYELQTNINKDYLIDMNDVEEQIIKLISEIKGKLEFDIELVDDFQVEDREDIEIPGITYNKPEDINLIDAKLRQLSQEQDLIKGVKPYEPESSSESESENKPKSTPPQRVIYNFYEKSRLEEEAKRKAEEEERKRLDKEALRDIGANQQLNPEEYKKLYPDVATQLKGIFGNPEVEIQQQHQQYGQYQQSPNFPAVRTFGQYQPQEQTLLPFSPSSALKMNYQQQPQQQYQPQQHIQEIIDADEAYCRSMSDNPEACKLDPKCYYSSNILNPSRRCHKDVKGLPK